MATRMGYHDLSKQGPICDICNRPRAKGKHDECSKERKARGFAPREKKQYGRRQAEPNFD